MKIIKRKAITKILITITCFVWLSLGYLSYKSMQSKQQRSNLTPIKRRLILLEKQLDDLEKQLKQLKVKQSKLKTNTTLK